MRTKVKGLVVREKPNGENAKLLTVLTDTCGLITVNARGVRKISAAYLKSAQVFAFSDMLLYEKNGFRTLTEASLITDFYALREDLCAYSLACYICEAASAFAVPGEESSGILRLALNTLYALENKSYDEAQIKAAFELKLCAEGGFLPDITACGSCGEALSGARVFDLRSGIALCGGCVAEGGETLLLSEPVCRAAAHIAGADMQKFMSFRISGGDLAVLAELAEKYLKICAERDFNTLNFYKKCKELT